MFKRIFLFLAVNFLVLMTINITLHLLGVGPYMSAQGLDYTSLLAFCAVFGFVGSFMSLLLSKWMAKTMMGVRVIDPANASPGERSLVQLVERLAQKAGLPSMPEVGIYDSPEINAFATGPSKRNALVAVSSGLLNSLDSAAVEGVLGHELSHVANGDMVTMTLLTGVVNTFVLFFARIAAWGTAQALRGDRDRDDGGGVSPMIYYLLSFVFEIAFSLLGSVLIAFYSRWREFRADAGGARVAGREKMVHALESLKATMEVAPVDNRAPALNAFKIHGKGTGLMALLSSHPDLDTRIERLKSGQY